MYIVARGAIRANGVGNFFSRRQELCGGRATQPPQKKATGSLGATARFTAAVRSVSMVAFGRGGPFTSRRNCDVLP